MVIKLFYSIFGERKYHIMKSSTLLGFYNSLLYAILVPPLLFILYLFMKNILFFNIGLTLILYVVASNFNITRPLVNYRYIGYAYHCL